jgi:hypothetical protein
MTLLTMHFVTLKDTHLALSQLGVKLTLKRVKRNTHKA